MSTTIDSLSIEISSNIGQADVKIDALAKSLGRLKENSNLTKVTNNLGKLSTQLATLKSSVAGLEVSKIRDLGTAMGELSGIQKLSGLGSALTTLKRLPDIAKQIDKIDITKFMNQMSNLAAGLKPLATQIDRIGTGFSKLPSKITSAAAATSKMADATEDVGEKMRVTNLDIFAFIENMETVFQYAGKVIDVFRGLIDAAIGWDGIQYRFGRTFGEDAEEVYQHILRINKELGINVQEFMQYSSMYGALLSGFGMDQDKVTTISVGLSELTYDLWAANNDVVKRYEDVATAVKSAITGEIEPIRNLGIALTEASLQEFIDSTNLAGLSIENMTEAQKSEIRYAAMVNAAMNQGIVGTYAKEMQTAEGALRSLSQSFKTLAQSLGSLFIPLLQVAVPYVTAFVDVVTDAVHALAELLGIELFKVDWSSTNAGVGGLATGAENVAAGIGDAAKAAKKLQDYTMGFDELNVIDPNTGSGSGGAGGAGGDGAWGSGLDLETVWDDSVFAQATKQAKELKEEVLGFLDKWKTELSILGAATSALAVTGLVSSLGKALGLGDGFLNTMSKIQKIAGSAIVVTIQFMFQKEYFSNFMSDEGELKDYLMALLVGGLGTWVSYKQWGPGGIVIGLGVTAIASLSAVWENGGVTDGESATTALTGVASGIGAIAMAFKLIKQTDVGTFFQLLKEGGTIGDVLAASFPSAANLLTKIGGIVKTVFSSLPSLLAKIPSLLVNAIKAIPGWGWIVAAIASVITLAIVDFDFTDMGYKLGHAIGAGLKKIGEWFGTALDWVVSIAKGCLEGINAAWEWVKEKFDIKNVFELIILIFNPVAWVTKIVPKMIEIGAEVLPGLWKGIKDGWNNFWGNIKEFIDGFVQGFKDALGIASPSTVFADIGKWIIQGLLNGITNKWKAVKEWFNTTVAPKFTKEYWTNLFNNIATATKDKLAEVKKLMSDKWADVVAWYNRSVAPKFTKQYWLDTFSNLKEGFTQTIKNAINSGIDMMNRFIGWLNGALSFSWDGLTIAGKTVYEGGSIQLFTIPSIPRLENGGVLEDGLFTMNRGEIAGKFTNGRSVVANNEMIVDGIAEGVYRAVVAAMGDSNRSQDQNVNVYLDGKQIYASVKRTEAQRGKTLMGNQLGYSY